MILGCGAELKNAFCINRDQYAFLSHHIGDLENYETLRSFESGIEHFERLFRIQPGFIAVDMHPNYLATRYGQALAAEKNLPILQVQHHHAHLATCLADNQITSDDPVIGLMMDGTGYGTDGSIWGGEVLVGGYSGFHRRFHLAQFPLPGGDAATRNPSRIALALLWSAGLDWDLELKPCQVVCSSDRTVIRSQLEHSINTPLTSSMGRLFDAVSALAGVRQTINYEGQAAIELESLCSPAETGAYEFDLSADEILVAGFLDQLLKDIHAGVSAPIISAKFHNGLAKAFVSVCKLIRQETAINTVALSGGVWQNITLLTKTYDLLDREGFTTLVHHNVPANDGGISLGQVAVAASFFQRNRGQ
jgi:hydrogenase maturation protein HypF